MGPSLNPQSRIGSNLKSCLSSMIMLYMIIHTIMILEILSKFHCCIGFLTISHLAYRTPNTLFTSFACPFGFGEVFFHGSLWLMNGLHKASPWRINAIYQEIQVWIDMTIDLKSHVMPFSLQNLPK